MHRHLCGIAAGLLLALATGDPALAQKSGGILKISFFDNPASMSLHEEATGAALRPMMGVFNNLVMYNQHEAQNRPDTIIPDLAESWAWSEDGKELTFRLRQGVKWHDGKPFTSADVKCTFEVLQGKAKDKLRGNPRKEWYNNVVDVTANGASEAVFHLERPQPALVMLLASGYSPIYLCHVTPAQMRLHPIGTGPFKFVEYKQNEHIKVVKNPDYWKPGLPYLDGIETTIIPNMSTRLLAFVTGKFDLMQATMPLLKDIKSQMPQVECDVVMDNNSRDLLINRAVPPFDNLDLRRAMTLSLDRQAFIDILTEGEGTVGGSIMPPPDGVWGM